MQIVNQLNEYISNFDPEWINRLKPASKEDLKLLKKYTFMEREGLEFPEDFVEYALCAGEDDGGVLTTEEWGGIFSIKSLVEYYKDRYEECPEGINPFEIEILLDDLGFSYYILLDKKNVIYYYEMEEPIEYQKEGVCSYSFKHFLFQCAVRKYEDQRFNYKERIGFELDVPITLEEVYEKEDNILAALAQELVDKYELECPGFNDGHFFCAYNEDFSIILEKHWTIWGRIMGKNRQKIREIIKPFLAKYGSEYTKEAWGL